ncbi:MAG TPA: ATP synthase F0 subunit C [Armatimonadota bacterium]|jgi:F-type H+-transporting ATPase subunit c
MIAVAIAIVGLALGVPIAVIGGSLGQGKAAAAALEGIARQPEAAGEIRVLLIIALALIESLVIYALLTFFLLLGNVGKLLEKVTS